MTRRKVVCLSQLEERSSEAEQANKAVKTWQIGPDRQLCCAMDKQPELVDQDQQNLQEGRFMDHRE